MPSWKTLLSQAFSQAPIATNRWGFCGLIQIHRYIYQALGQAGIENRSPFNSLHILRIRWLSGGNPDKVRTLCIDSITRMERPGIGYSGAPGLILSFTLVFSLSLMVSPRTANTYLTPINGNTILSYTIQPLADLDKAEVLLPSSSDYQLDGYSPLTDTGSRHNMQGLANSEWIQQQPDAYYSLQLLSASNPDSLKTFCQQHNICNQSAFYRVTVKGKTLYRLLYGAFSNNKSAKAARTRLSLALQQQSPWARQFRQIKQEIQRN